MMNDILADILSLLNVIFMAIFSYYELKCIFRIAFTQWKWIKLLYGIIGIYWTGLYIFVFFANSAYYDTVVFGRVFVRPALTILFAIMAIGAIQREKCK